LPRLSLLAGVLGVLSLALSAIAPPASAQTLVERCMEIKKTQGMTAYLACLASGQPGPPAAQDPMAEVRESIDWVFRDAGAKATYERFRRQGFTPFQAVVAAQGHNPAAQALLEENKGWAIAYLATRGQVSGAGELTDVQLTTQVCSCVTITPAGDTYRVTNSCNLNMRFTIGFIDAAGASPPMSIPAGIIVAGGTATVNSPRMTVPSIASTLLESSRNGVTCRY
jgi:hypothetical protein